MTLGWTKTWTGLKTGNKLVLKVSLPTLLCLINALLPGCSCDVLPAEMHNRTDSLSRKPFPSDRSLGRKEEIAESLEWRQNMPESLRWSKYDGQIAKPVGRTPQPTWLDWKDTNVESRFQVCTLLFNLSIPSKCWFYLLKKRGEWGPSSWMVASIRIHSLLCR